MKFNFFTLGGKFFWEDVFFYQGWRIQRKVNTSKYRLLDTYNIRRENGTFETCKDSLLKYISACEIHEPLQNAVIIIHGFGRTTNSTKNLTSELENRIEAQIISVNYASLKADLRHNSEILLQFIRNLAGISEIYFVTVGVGCLVLRKMFDICDNYRSLNIRGIININPINSGSDFAFLISRFSSLKKVFGPMIKDITPDESLKISKVPQDITLYLIFSPSKFSSYIKKIFSPLESFPQLSPPSEESYSPFHKEIRSLTWFPMNNENMKTACLEYLEEFMQK